MESKSAEARRALKGRSRQSTAEQGPATTGQGAAAGSAKLSTEQRTKITTIIQAAQGGAGASQRFGACRNPRAGERAFLPAAGGSVRDLSRWRGYDYILVGDEILVIDPRTHEIVAILEA